MWSLFDGLLSEPARRQLTNGCRNLFISMKPEGCPDAWLDLFRKNLPKMKVGVDLWIPEPEDVVESLWRLKIGAGGRFYALYNIIFGYGILYVALCEVYAVYAFVTSRLVDVAVYFVCLCVEAS